MPTRSDYPNGYTPAYYVENLLSSEVHSGTDPAELPIDRSEHVAHYLEDLTRLLVAKGVLSEKEVFDLVGGVMLRLDDEEIR